MTARHARRGGVRALRVVVAIAGLVPVGAGLAGVVLGPAVVDGGALDVSGDSHFRYLSGLLLGIGLAFWSTIPRLEAQGSRFRLLTAIVVAGGLARLAGVVVNGLPGPPMVAGLAMELVVTPLLCLWQARTQAAY